MAAVLKAYVQRGFMTDQKSDKSKNLNGNSFDVSISSEELEQTFASSYSAEGTRKLHGEFSAVSFGSKPQKCASGDGIDDGDELIDWLQMLLEAEHAGALIMVDSLKEACDEKLIQKLEILHISEAESCQRLRRCLKRLGAIPSREVGAFHAKAMAIANMDERLQLIARGQSWVAKRLSERLPTIRQRWLYDDLQAVLKLHA